MSELFSRLINFCALLPLKFHRNSLWNGMPHTIYQWNAFGVHVHSLDTTKSFSYGVDRNNDGVYKLFSSSSAYYAFVKINTGSRAIRIHEGVSTN